MSPQRSRKLELVALKDEQQYARCLLEPGQYSIGQERTNEITVDEPSVSSRHACLTVTDSGEVLIQDTGSANGTYVDGRFAEEMTPVNLDSRIEVGACQLRLR